MKTFKSLFIFTALSLFVLTGCNKDTQAPVISAFSVNGTQVQAGSSGQHALGSTVDFAVTATDDTELILFQITEFSSNNILLDEGTLTGTSDNFAYSFGIDSTSNVSGDSVTISFLIEDGAGSSDDATYKIYIQ